MATVRSSEYTVAKLKRHLTWAAVSLETLLTYSPLWMVYFGRLVSEKKENKYLKNKLSK